MSFLSSNNFKIESYSQAVDASAGIMRYHVNMEIDERDVLLWVFVVFSALSIAVISGPNLKKNFGSGNSVSTSTAGMILPSVVCNFASDGEASQKAKDAGDSSYCICVKDEKVKLNCQESAQNAAYFAQARAQFKSDFCALIKNDGNLKASCEAMVSSGIAYLKEKDPQFLANVYSNTHNSLAIQEYEKLLKVEPNNLKNLLSLASAYAEAGLKEQEQSRSQTPYVEKAFAIIEKAKNLDPNNSEVYRVEGYIYEIKPEIFKAIGLYDKAIELDSNNILAYVGRGHASNMMGLLEQALGDFKKAAELDVDKQYISIYSNLCRLESSKGDLLEEAIKNCGIVIAATENVDPTLKAETYQILATIYIQTKNYPEAENYLLKAKVLSPGDSNLYVALANLAIAEGKYNEAQVYAQKATELSPTKAIPYQALSYALYKQEKYAEAISAANKGLSLIDGDVSLLMPNKPSSKKDLYYILANIYNRTGDKENETKSKALGDAIMNN